MPQSPVELFYDFCLKTFGYEPDLVKKILLSHGFDSYYQDSRWTYVETVRQHWETQVALSEFPKDCPMCHAAIERDTKWDGLMRVKWGWRCVNNAAHFMMWRLNKIRMRMNATNTNV
jgi:hypothetical protein